MEHKLSTVFPLRNAKPKKIGILAQELLNAAKEILDAEVIETITENKESISDTDKAGNGYLEFQFEDFNCWDISEVEEPTGMDVVENKEISSINIGDPREIIIDCSDW